MSEIEISNLQDHDDLEIELLDEAMEQIIGGGYMLDALDSVMAWVNSGNDGSISAGLETAGKGLLAMPVIVTLAAADHLEHMVDGAVHIITNR
jgi:hypothetical protein